MRTRAVAASHPPPSSVPQDLNPRTLHTSMWVGYGNHATHRPYLVLRLLAGDPLCSPDTKHRDSDNGVTSYQRNC